MATSRRSKFLRDSAVVLGTAGGLGFLDAEAATMTDVSNLDDLAAAISSSSPKIKAYAQAQAAATQAQEAEIRTHADALAAHGASLDDLIARVTVLEDTPPPPPPPPDPTGLLELNPDDYLPADWRNFRVERIGTGHSGTVSGTGDVIVVFDAPLLNKNLILGTGLRHRVIIGGEIRADSGNVTCVRSYGGGGVTYIEGLKTGGPAVVDTFAVQSPNPQKLVIQNCDTGAAINQSAHPDVLQTQGCKLDALHINRLHGLSVLQGIFLKNETGIVAGAYIHDVQMRRVWIDSIPNSNNDHLLWQETADIGPITLDQFHIRSQDNRVFGLDVWPQTDGYGMGTSGRRAVLAADGKSLTFVNTNIQGSVVDGPPPASFLLGFPGMGYVSPGYA